MALGKMLIISLIVESLLGADDPPTKLINLEKLYSKYNSLFENG